MNRNYFILIGTLFLLLATCEKKMEDQKIFFRLMEKNQKDITILQVNSNVRFLDFTVEITLANNDVELRFLHENRTFYAIRFHSFDTFSVDGTLCAKPGFREIESSSFDWVFALFLIVFAVRSSGGFRNINAQKHD